MKTNPVNFTIDKENKKISITREFAAPKPKVWAAWTQSELLEQWWAPKPWKARTKTMDFREGGHWLYAMVGPKGEEHWARADYTSIKPQDSYTGEDSFCDEEGNINESMGTSTWKNSFSESSDVTVVNMHISFKRIEDLNGMIEMGFKEGMLMALDNLEELLAN